MALEDFPAFGDEDDRTEVVVPFSPGSFFGERFRIEEPLGAGAMGTVFRATDLEKNEDVALKVLLKRRHDQELRERFAREAEILRRITHPAIVGIRGFGHTADGQVPWLAMELIGGETLGARLRRAGRFDPEQLVPIVRAIADALETAHAHGVVHRDLKPDHIFLVPDDPASVVRIVDFGLSRTVTARKLTKTGSVLGTPRYMAPELLASARNAAPASDIYALGVIVYEALVGRSPFAASDHGQLLGAILQGRRQPVAEYRTELGPLVDEVLDRAMAREPGDRFNTPLEFAEAFAQATGVRGSLPPRLSLPDGARATPTPERPRPRWVRYLLMLLAACTMAGIGGAVTYLLLR